MKTTYEYRIRASRYDRRTWEEIPVFATLTYNERPLENVSIKFFFGNQLAERYGYEIRMNEKGDSTFYIFRLWGGEVRCVASWNPHLLTKKGRTIFPQDRKTLPVKTGTATRKSQNSHPG